MFKKRMLFFGLLLTLVFGLSVEGMAKVSPEEAARLKSDFTPMGSERAGNADGSIPKWEGGMTAPPEGWKKADGYVNPFPNDKVLFTIKAANMDKYADKLSEGQKAMLKRFPDSYFIPVYQTRRTEALPQRIYDNTFKNATECTLTEDGFAFKGGWSGTPFPIPKNGNEMILNHVFRYQGVEQEYSQLQTLINNGTQSDGGTSALEICYPWYDPNSSPDKFQGVSGYIWAEFISPARRKGEFTLVHDPLDLSKDQRKAWRYIPGARRVRMAPYLAYDGINPAFGGMVFQDEGNGLFFGAIDRYNWKIVGKKEMYIPYNCYVSSKASTFDGRAAIFATHHANQSNSRWELHRVWVLEATVREGQRHQYARRTFYIDEDSWSVMLHDAYDAQGSLWRTSACETMNIYDVPMVMFRNQFYYDLQTTTWGSNHADSAFKNEFKDRLTMPLDNWAVENLRRTGVR